MSSGALLASGSVVPPRLKKRTILWYALPGFAQAGAGLITGGLLTQFYTDTLKTPVTYVSVSTFVAGMIASYAQLTLGYLSDRTKTRWGRRRPYILFGAPLVALSFLFLMFPPEVTGKAAALWFFIFYVSLQLFTDFVNVAVNALGTEITQIDEERSRLYSWNMVAVVTGLLVSAIAQAVMSGFMSKRTMFRVLGIAIAVAFLVGCWLLAINVRESGYFFRRTAMPLIPGMRSCSHNKPWLVTLVAGALLSLMNEVTGLFVYLLQYVIHVDPNKYFGVAAGVYALSQISGVPFVMWIMRRWGKLAAYRLSMLLVSVYSVVGFIATTIPGPWPFILSVGLFGFALTGLNVVGGIITSDCIDLDELHTGKRRESTYHSLGNLPQKAFSIAGKSLPLMILHIAGYVPKVPQNDSVKFLLRFFTTLFPGIVCLFAYAIFRFYTIDEATHEAIVEAIGARNRGEENVIDPVSGLPVVVARLAARGGFADTESPPPKTILDVDADILRGDSTGSDSGALVETDVSEREMKLLEEAQEKEDNSIEYNLLYFSRRDLRMLGSNWRKRFIVRFVSTTSLWFVHMIVLFVLGGLLFATEDINARNYGFLAVLAGAIASLAFAYQMARIKGVRWVLRHSVSQIANYVAAYAQITTARKTGAPIDHTVGTPTAPRHSGGSTGADVPPRSSTLQSVAEGDRESRDSETSQGTKNEVLAMLIGGHSTGSAYDDTENDSDVLAALTEPEGTCCNKLMAKELFRFFAMHAGAAITSVFFYLVLAHFKSR